MLYVAVAFVLTGIVSYDKLNVSDPIAVGIDAAGLGWLSSIVKFGIVMGLRILDFGAARRISSIEIQFAALTSRYQRSSETAVSGCLWA